MANADEMEAFEEFGDSLQEFAAAVAMEPCAECASKDVVIKGLRGDVERLKKYGGPNQPPVVSDGALEAAKKELEAKDFELNALRQKLAGWDTQAQTLQGLLTLIRHIGRASFNGIS